MLLVGAGLLLASFQRVLAVNPGFDASHVLTGTVNPPSARYKDDAAVRAFWTRLTERVRALPGVEAAGATGTIPLSAAIRATASSSPKATSWRRGNR